VVALLGVLLLGPGMAGAATVQTVGLSDQIATGILNLEFDGTFYNVAFLYTTGKDLYGAIPPRTYDFDTEGDASGAVDAVNSELNDHGGIEEVGILGSSHDVFNIGFADGELNPIGSIQTVQGEGVFNDFFIEWENVGLSILDKDVLAVYAEFQAVLDVLGSGHAM